MEVCGLSMKLEITENVFLTLAVATYFCCTGTVTGKHKQNALPEGERAI